MDQPGLLDDPHEHARLAVNHSRGHRQRRLREYAGSVTIAVLESGPARRTALAGHELLLVLQQRPVLDQLVQVIVRKMLPAIGITIAVFVVVFVGLFPLRPHYAGPEREGDPDRTGRP
jgi:hypothetical protein